VILIVYTFNTKIKKGFIRSKSKSCDKFVI
jgi:hypothetical protein